MEKKYFAEKIFFASILGLVCTVCYPCSNNQPCLPVCKEVTCGGGVPAAVRIRSDAIDTDGVPHYNPQLTIVNNLFNKTRAGVKQWIRQNHPFLD